MNAIRQAHQDNRRLIFTTILPGYSVVKYHKPASNDVSKQSKHLRRDPPLLESALAQKKVIHRSIYLADAIQFRCQLEASSAWAPRKFSIERLHPVRGPSTVVKRKAMLSHSSTDITIVARSRWGVCDALPLVLATANWLHRIIVVNAIISQVYNHACWSIMRTINEHCVWSVYPDIQAE
eukprot:6463046-Amphidinium_carterae.3